MQYLEQDELSWDGRVCGCVCQKHVDSQAGLVSLFFHTEPKRLNNTESLKGVLETQQCFVRMQMYVSYIRFVDVYFIVLPEPFQRNIKMERKKVK